MAALMLQHRESPGGGAVVYEWSLDDPEPHCEASGGLIIFGTDRRERHSDAELSCVFEWRMPPECQHPNLSFDDPARPLCVLCGVRGADASGKWLKYTTPAAAGFESYDEVIALGDAVDDHSAHLTPEGA